jgi:hypothetical protein
MKKFILAILLVLVFLPAVTLAQDSCTPGYKGSQLCNALPQFGGREVTDIPSLMAASMSWLASVIGTLAMVMIIFAGAKMVFSRGDSKAVTEAKASMTYAIYGLALVIFSYVIISGVQYFVRFNSAIQPGQATPGFFQNPLGDADLMSFVTNTAKSFLGIIGTATVLYIILSGFRYVTAAGNEEQIKKAREGLTWAIFGLVSVVFSYIIVTVIVNTIFKSAV